MRARINKAREAEKEAMEQDGENGGDPIPAADPAPAEPNLGLVPALNPINIEPQN